MSITEVMAARVDTAAVPRPRRPAADHGGAPVMLQDVGELLAAGAGGLTGQDEDVGLGQATPRHLGQRVGLIRRVVAVIVSQQVKRLRRVQVAGDEMAHVRRAAGTGANVEDDRVLFAATQ